MTLSAEKGNIPCGLAPIAHDHQSRRLASMQNSMRQFRYLPAKLKGGLASSQNVEQPGPKVWRAFVASDNLGCRPETPKRT